MIRSTLLVQRMVFLACLVFFAGCSNVYYSTMETLGKHKRDLLRDNVQEVSEEQQEASDQFRDALTRLQELTGNVANQDLARTYEELQHDYEQCADKATAVKERIEKIDTIATDLFEEWEQEIDSMSSARLKQKSRGKLQTTRQRYGALYRTMKRAEKRLDPVLIQLKDQVLYLKHNLNANAIAGLQGEVQSIETDISSLLREMQRSIDESQRFIATLPQ